VRTTTERLDPRRTQTVEERVLQALHRYAYTVVEDYAASGDRLLEIGFGEGYGAEIVGPWVAEYVGVDVEQAVVDHAEEAYGRAGVSFVHYDGGRLPFPDGAFDLVIAFQVLEHVDDPQALLREASRVARPGAPVLVATPNRNHRVAAGERPWNRYHVREFSPEELQSAMRGVFDEIELFGIVGSPAMNAIERERVARARRLARLDRLGLRYVLPEGIDTRARALLRRRGGRSASDVPVGVEHVRRSREGLSEALDLLAVGRV
jgi:SAM-dependent methyltransferase